MADANDTVEATLDRASRLFSSGMGNTLGIMKEADADLSARLHGLVKKKGTKDLKFTEAQALLYRQQIRLAQKYLDERLLGHTHAQALKAVATGTAATVKLLTTLEKRFTGISKPLQLESQQMQDNIVRGLGSSLLRQNVASVGRYSAAMIGDFERVMRVGALSGMTQHQVISKLVAQGELGGIKAASLNAAEPAYFPKPAGYVTRRYWAERIVRTETAYAYNAANQATISTARVTDFPDMQKKILAHFDNRTAPDSIYVHGQIRPVAGLFHDGAGREYLHPPARPNDRETVIPWRPVWHELPATAPAPPEEQAKAIVAAEPGLAPASKGQFLVQSSRARIVQLVEKLKAQAAEHAESTDAGKQLQAAKAAAAAAHIEATQKMGMVKLVDAKVLARAQAAQLAKQTKGGIDPAVLKAKAEAYKAEIQAKAAVKIAEAEAAKGAKLKVAASKHLILLGEESGELFDNPGPDLVKHLKKTAKERPELFAEMKKQLGVGGDSPHWVSVGMAKKLAPELDYSSFKKKAPGTKAPNVPVPSHVPAPNLPPLEFKAVSGYIDIHDATTGQKLAFMKPGPTPGSVSVTPPAQLTGYAAKTFATQEEGAGYAIQVSTALKLQKAEQAAIAAKAAAVVQEQATAQMVPMREAYDRLMAAAAKAPAGPRSFDLESLVHAAPPARNSEPMMFDRSHVEHDLVKTASEKFGSQINKTQFDAIRSFTGSGYTALRKQERDNKRTVDVKALAESFALPRLPGDPTVGMQVWRGVHGIPKALVQKWLKDGELDHDGTASASWRRGTAFNFASIDEQDSGSFSGDGHGDTFKVVYRWANKSGRPVETFSRHTTEGEILQPKKARFNVRAAYRPPGTRQMVFIELEEK